ncbi:hypothetical protein GCM10009779_58890 [Polymorphospora rubra]
MPQPQPSEPPSGEPTAVGRAPVPGTAWPPVRPGGRLPAGPAWSGDQVPDQSVESDGRAPAGPAWSGDRVPDRSVESDGRAAAGAVGSGGGVPPVPPGAGAAPRPGRRRPVVGAVALALALVGGAGGGALAVRLAEPRTATSVVTASTVATGGTADLAAVAAAVAPSVVTIEVAAGGGTATGSGVVLSADGRILTNNHVVEDASGAVTVRLADGRTTRAGIVGTDPASDLAVLQAQGVDDLTPAVFGDSSAVRVGDTVLAVGSPLGLAGTVTAGIVSAVDRTADTLTGLIQTDAPVNAGSSGGAVVDTAGRVVGITVAIATTGTETGNIGVGFAIPSDTAESVVTRLVAQAGGAGR